MGRFVLLVGGLAVGLLGIGHAQARSPVSSYPSHATFSATPTGGGAEGRGQHVSVTITSPKATCRQYRRFKLDLESLDGHLEETHLYRTDTTGTWTLEIVALPTAPTRVAITVPPKRLDGAHRCQGTTTTARLS